MINYKDILGFLKKEPLVIEEINGRDNFFGTSQLYKMTNKYEMKPRRKAFSYYSMHVTDSLMYQEFDLGAYLVSQLRSTSHYIVKSFTKDDIIYINL